MVGWFSLFVCSLLHVIGCLGPPQDVDEVNSLGETKLLSLLRAPPVCHEDHGGGGVVVGWFFVFCLCDVWEVLFFGCCCFLFVCVFLLVFGWFFVVFFVFFFVGFCMFLFFCWFFCWLVGCFFCLCVFLQLW